MRSKWFSRAWLASGLAAVLMGGYEVKNYAEILLILGHPPTVVSKNIAIARWTCGGDLTALRDAVENGDTVTVTCMDGHQLRCAFVESVFWC